MSINFNFPAGWWLILSIIYLIWLTIFLLRKSYRKGELKVQALFAIVTVVLAFIIEIVAVSGDVWTYFPGNWPIVLWVGYFGGGLVAYQLVKLIEEWNDK